MDRSVANHRNCVDAPNDCTQVDYKQKDILSGLSVLHCDGRQLIVEDNNIATLFWVVVNDLIKIQLESCDWIMEKRLEL